LKKLLTNIFAPLPKYTRDFIIADFNLLKYLLIGLFVSLAIGINYIYNFEDTFIDIGDLFPRFLRYILFYGFAYFGGVLIVKLSDKKIEFTKKPVFWIMSVLGILVISFDGSYNGTYRIARSFVSAEEYRYVGRLMTEFRNFITLFLPLLVIWFFSKQKGDSFYGLTLKNAKVRPYFLLLLLMVPLIALATTDSSFLKTYPLFKSYGVDQYWNISKAYLAIPFELLYSTSFLNVELFFRGFLIIGMIRIMGKDAILPMVMMYAFLHFGKPMGEAISSVFGGYLLGIFAYYSRTIWGGVIVHGGIALMMELAAFMAKS
jgi:hypothetical protein